jgi:hypothetical protein
VNLAFGAAIAVALGVFLWLTWLAHQADAPNYSEIEDHLFMGGSVESPPRGTQAVLNLCELDDPHRCEVYLWESIPDAAPAPDLDWLRRMVYVIDEQQAAGCTTYVHCRNGVSRSGFVIVAYEMYKHRWTRDQALEFVRTKRPEIWPYPAFMERLLEWERASRSHEAPSAGKAD